MATRQDRNRHRESIVYCSLLPKMDLLRYFLSYGLLDCRKDCQISNLINFVYVYIYIVVFCSFKLAVVDCVDTLITIVSIDIAYLVLSRQELAAVTTAALWRVAFTSTNGCCLEKR
jgi:hypothetical protein